MVAKERLRGRKPHVPALSRLEQGSRKPFARQVELGHDLVVHPYRPLLEQPASLARGADSQSTDEQ